MQAQPIIQSRMWIVIAICVTAWSSLAWAEPAATATKASGSNAHDSITHGEFDKIIEHATGEHVVDPGHVDGHPDYNVPPLAFDLTMFLFTLIVFGSFVYWMRPLVWVPLINSLNSREERVSQATADARAARLEIEQLKQQADRRLAEIQEQVSSILAKTRAEAEARKLEIVAAAEQEARRIKESALAEIEQARKFAIQDLESRVEEQVALATEHVAGRRF
ncbi:ATP synthase F0 subunit B [Planctomicrobium sp. SH664]|uniref:ATP synthase F0 subunit B n=1 Tax=Planctomicrobium sp. SH664 TaxID=3448125 RepID=UPI003F5C4DD8